jgi:hypothetical protein
MRVHFSAIDFLTGEADGRFRRFHQGVKNFSKIEGVKLRKFSTKVKGKIVGTGFVRFFAVAEKCRRLIRRLRPTPAGTPGNHFAPTKSRSY